MQAAVETTPWQRFTRAIKTPTTRKIYRNSMILYMESCGAQDPKALLDGGNEVIEDHIMDFIARQAGLSDSIINTRLAAIKLFYDMNRRPLAWKLIKRNVKITKKLKDRGYTKEEIAKLIGIAPLRSKVVVLLLASTGMRVGAIPGLTRANLTPIDRYGIYRLTVYDGEKEEYHTYCTPECRAAIDDYFAYRERCGEPLKDSSPLIRQEFDKTISTQVRNPKQVGESMLSSLIKRLSVDAGVRKVITSMEGQNAARIRHDVKVAHGFRKYFDTITTTEGMSLLYVDMLEGHNVKLKGNYFKPTDEELLEGNDKMRGYVSAIDALTVNEENRLKRENVQLKEEKTHWEKHATKLDSVIERLEKKGIL